MIAVVHQDTEKIVSDAKTIYERIIYPASVPLLLEIGLRFDETLLVKREF